MSAFNLHFHRGGVHLPQLNLWLDSHEPKIGSEQVFISHAHSDHIGVHREVILTPPTSRLMHARLQGDWLEHQLAFDQPFSPKGCPTPYEITLLPAGHILGSAMAWLCDGKQSLLYTGDFKLRPSLTAELCSPRPADILIMETTFGRPAYRFPPTADVIKGIIRFCQESIDNEEIPILLGYALGKCQELLQELATAGFPIMVHENITRFTPIYEQSGCTFPPFQQLDLKNASGNVLICPPSFTNSSTFKNLGKTRTAILTGWAVDPTCRFRYKVDAAFPLSDHADFSELLQLIQVVNPKKVYTLHGFATEFAATLREMGIDAQSLSQQDQLSLDLAFSLPKKKRVIATSLPTLSQSSLSPPPTLDSLEWFAQTCFRISNTTKKLEKTHQLSDYFRQLTAEQLPHAATWFTGNPFPPSQNRTLQLGWAVIRDTLCEVGGLDQSEFGQIYLKHSDLGEAAQEVMSITPRLEHPYTLIKIHELFLQLLAAKGPTGKLPILRHALLQVSPLAGKYLVKILTGDLRIGLKEGLVEESLAGAFGATLDSVKRANLLVGDIGQTATLCACGQLDSVSLMPFRPIKYMLASPEETSATIAARIANWQAERELEVTLPLWNVTPAEGWSEEKFDGIRAQIHKVGSHVEIYSRDLKEITSSFGDVADKIRALPHNLVLDGEIVAMREDVVLPYNELQKRLGRRENDMFIREEIPVQFVAFDLLWLDSKNLLNEPLWSRRQSLVTLPQNSFRLSQIVSVRNEYQIENAFIDSRNAGNEGLMIKDPSSLYTPGRRGMSWLKLKKALATLDCVVVGVEHGHGKRKTMLSDYTFALRDVLSGELKTIGKAFTGLTNAEITLLTQHFLKQTVTQTGRYHSVIPDTVIEVAFDLIQFSDRHDSGLAMRFPRIVRLRPDKSPEQIDTIADARALVDSKKQ